jgi:hypothetical protein
VVDRRIDSYSSKIKDYQIGICCLSFQKHASLMSKNKEWLPLTRDNASNWSDIIYLWSVVSVS